MRFLRSHWWLLGCLTAALAITIWTLVAIGELRSQTQAPFPAGTPLREDQDVSTFTSTWTSGGIERSHTVTKDPDETAEQFAARCASEFAAMLEAFPKDT